MAEWKKHHVAARERCRQYDAESPGDEYWDENNSETVREMAHVDLPAALDQIEILTGELIAAGLREFSTTT